MPNKYYNPQDDVVQIKDGKRTPVQAYDLYQGLHYMPKNPMDTLHENEVRAKQANQNPHLSMRFDGKELTLIHQQENKSIEYHFPAVSGKPIEGEKETFEYSKERQKIENVGPIPEGKHEVDLNTTKYFENEPWLKQKLSKFGIGNFPGGTDAWGEEHIDVKLNQKVAQQTGRSGITIHGGATPGSRGCIDLVNHAQAFFDKLEKLKGNQTQIPLTVDYSKTPKTVKWDKNAQPTVEEKNKKS